IMITYKPATGNQKEQKELPFRMAMLGDFTLKQDDTPLEERKRISVDKDTFNDVMRSMKLDTQVNVANKLSGKDGDELGVKLNFAPLKDFEPEQTARQVPELAQMLQMREVLTALKAPFANRRELLKKITEIVKDETKAKALMDSFIQKEGEG